MKCAPDPITNVVASQHAHAVIVFVGRHQVLESPLRSMLSGVYEVVVRPVLLGSATTASPSATS